MKQRLFLTLLLIGTIPGLLMTSGTTAHADDHGNGKGHDHDEVHGEGHDKGHDHDEGHGEGHDKGHGNKASEHTVVVVHNDRYVEHDVYHYDAHAPYNARYFRGSDYI